MKKIILFFLPFVLTSNLVFSQLKHLANPKNFEIGPCIAVSPLQNEAQYRNTIITEFNTAVAENAFKMYIWTGPNSYNFSDADLIANFCRQNNIKLRGHCLVWYSVVPDWLRNGNYTSQQIRQMLEAYIKAVVGRYKDIVYEWDVVNEAISDNYPYSFRSDDFWYQKLGADYVKLAFQWAHEADPNCKLYYNDYNTEGMSEKANAVYNLVRQLKEQNVPIHGVGWQCHFYHTWQVSNEYYENLIRLRNLGLEVKVTELDLRMPLPVDSQKLIVQARGYADMTYFCLSNKIGMIMWGFTDKHSWVPQFFSGEGAALIFDENYNKKPAYYAIEAVLKSVVNGAIYNSDMENGPYCWVANGTCNISTTTAQRRSGNRSLLVSGRANAWSGPAQYVNWYLWENGQGSYEVGAWVYSTTADQFKITIFVRDAGTQDRYLSIPAVSVPANQWTEVKGTINVTWSGVLRVARLYIESTNSTGNFYVDDVYMIKSSTSGGGGSGSQTPTIVNVIQDVYLIDDCDDGDTINRFGGSWYNYADNGSTITPRPFAVTSGGMNPEGYCGYYSWRLGSTVQYPYAGMGTNLSDSGVVDLRNYDGISFWYKATRPHIFMVRMPTDGEQNGWASYQITLSSSANWTKRVVLFSELSLPSWSPNTPDQYPLRLDNINTIAFQSTDGQGAVGELYVDDIYLVKRVTATADKIYRITINVNPQGSGSVYIKPNQPEYIAGSTVTFLAVANSGWRFSSWSGAAQGTNRQINVVVSTNLVITANFTQFTDTTPPQVTISTPANNSTVSGVINIVATVTDDTGVSRVLFYIDNVCVSTDTTSPYSYSWDTRLVSNGTHTIRVVAYDTSNNTNSVQIVVNVNNQTQQDTTPPQISIVLPLNNTTVSGSVLIQVTATDDVGISKVLFYIDDVCVSTDTTSPYSYSWDTTLVSNGFHTIRVVSYDTAGNSSQASIVVNVNNAVEDMPPVIVSVSGVSGVLSGVVNIQVSATDDVGISKVELWMDNQLIATLLQPPYSYSLNTKNYPDGMHSLVVIVYDTTGKTAQQSYELNIDNEEQTTFDKDKLLLNMSDSGKNNVIDFGDDVEWVKVYGTDGRLVYEAKRRIDKTSNLKIGVYIYKAKFKDGSTKIGSISIIR